jgi:hypothetical protein
VVNESVNGCDGHRGIDERLVTTLSAAEAGISRRAWPGWSNAVGWSVFSRGVYRLVHSHRDPLAPYREAILWGPVA